MVLAIGAVRIALAGIDVGEILDARVARSAVKEAQEAPIGNAHETNAAAGQYSSAG
jgi:hypothetical protein